MPTWKMTLPDISKLDQGKQIEALYNVLSDMNARLSWITAKYDSQNVKRLDTNETVIKSAEGETIINGPIIEMYDASSVLRLKQGLNTATSTFLFALYNAAGNNVFEVDSNGEMQFAGKPLIKMYDAQAIPVLRLKQGYDAATGNFVYELYNAAGVKTMGTDSSGDGTFTGTITGGTIQTAVAGNSRIVITGNTLKTYYYNGVSETLMGPAWGVGLLDHYGDLSLYDQGTETFRIENALGLTGWTLRPMNGGGLVVGYGGANTYASGVWSFSTADSVAGLTTDSAGSYSSTTGSGGTPAHTHSFSIPNHSHTVIN